MPEAHHLPGEMVEAEGRSRSTPITPAGITTSETDGQSQGIADQPTIRDCAIWK